MAQTARSLPTSPILNGTDALADLTRNLDDQLRMDALKQQRGPSPFQVQLHMLFALCAVSCSGRERRSDSTLSGLYCADVPHAHNCKGCQRTLLRVPRQSSTWCAQGAYAVLAANHL